MGALISGTFPRQFDPSLVGSGLWNRNHLDDAYESGFLAVFEEHVRKMPPWPFIRPILWSVPSGLIGVVSKRPPLSPSHRR